MKLDLTTIVLTVGAVAMTGAVAVALLKPRIKAAPPPPSPAPQPQPNPNVPYVIDLPKGDTFGFYIRRTGDPAKIHFYTKYGCDTDSDIAINIGSSGIEAQQYDNGAAIDMGANKDYVPNASGRYHIQFSRGEIKITDMDSNKCVFDGLPSVLRSSFTVGPFTKVTLENAQMEVVSS